MVLPQRLQARRHRCQHVQLRVPLKGHPRQPLAFVRQGCRVVLDGPQAIDPQERPRHPQRQGQIAAQSRYPVQYTLAGAIRPDDRLQERPRLLRRHEIQLDPFRPRQGHRPARCDDHPAGRRRNQGGHLPTLRSIVEDHQHPLAIQHTAIQGRQRLKGIGQLRSWSEATDHLRHRASRVERRPTGTGKVDEQLPIGIARPQPVPHMHCQRRLAETAHPVQSGDHSPPVIALQQGQQAIDLNRPSLEVRRVRWKLMKTIAMLRHQKRIDHAQAGRIQMHHHIAVAGHENGSRGITAERYGPVTTCHDERSRRDRLAQHGLIGDLSPARQQTIKRCLDWVGDRHHHSIPLGSSGSRDAVVSSDDRSGDVSAGSHPSFARDNNVAVLHRGRIG